MILIQMHGAPGSGKSTLARAIGRLLPAVVLDKDVIMSPLVLAGMEPAAAGGTSYETMRALADGLLEEGQSVVLDSPCYWPEIERNGREMASRRGAPWVMVECECPEDVIDRRIASRKGLPSQPTTRPADMFTRPGMYSPECERIVVDSTLSVDETATMVVSSLATHHSELSS